MSDCRHPTTGSGFRSQRRSGAAPTSRRAGLGCVLALWLVAPVTVFGQDPTRSRELLPADETDAGAARKATSPGHDGHDGLAVPAAESTPPDREEFIRLHGPRLPAPRRVRGADFLAGRTHTEAIEAALASRHDPAQTLTLVLDGQEWRIDRAIVLESNTELLIDGCTLKLADGVFDNVIRIARLEPDPDDPNGACRGIEPVHDVRVAGLHGAVIEGPDQPRVAPNPRTGVTEKWLGDFFGWRTVAILVAGATRYEVCGVTMQKTQCWAISQERCRSGFFHDIVFRTAVKNGDGINFRNGCSHGWVENISGHTSDDTVACTALDATLMKANARYIWPMQALGYPQPGASDADIHDIVIRNITTSGRHHGVICLATSPQVHHITIDGVREIIPSSREACVKIYTGYGTGYRPGNLHDIAVRNVSSLGAQYAVMVNAGVRDVSFAGIRQAKPGGEVHLFRGDSRNLTIAPGPEPEQPK